MQNPARPPFRWKGLAAYLLAALLVCVLPAHADNTPASPATPATIEGLGRGTATLGGPWQFHLGDNPAWANPTFDDTTGQNGWEQLSADESWGAQGHYGYYGYAWYRRRVDVAPVPGASPDLSLFIRNVGDVFEVFWNGVRIGGVGTFPPHLDWGSSVNRAIIDMGPVRSGVLAVRVFKTPHASNEDGAAGGFMTLPLIGSPPVMAAIQDAGGFHYLVRQKTRDALTWLYCLAAFLSFVGWVRDRSQRTLLWIAMYTSMLVIDNIINSLLFPIPLVWTQCAVQAIIQVREISQWFVLLWLLQLVDSPRLVRALRRLAVLIVTTGVLDGLILFLYPRLITATQYQVIDAVLTGIIIPVEIIPILLVVYALIQHKRLDSARWIVAVCAVLNATAYAISNVTIQGVRFTHWTIAQRLEAFHLTLFGAPYPLILILRILLFLSIVYAAVRYSIENSRRQTALEQEFQSARELQQILVPEALPSIPGFTLTSAYKPAQEVGGDFFQVIPLPDDSTVIVLGDVSGKGLKAAMTVSLIVGAIRTLAEISSSPALLLEGLNRRLHGRLQGGFTTCIALHIDAQGLCTLSSAGHPAPILNQTEVDLPGALPLGLIPSATYDEVELRLREGDHLALYTDGLLEARNAAGELYGFERLHLLFGQSPTATRASEEAVAFGQDDDITVLTLTRHVPGDQAPTPRVTPNLVLA